MAMSYAQSSIPYHGPEALKPVWQDFVVAYLEDKECAGSIEKKSEHLALFDALLFKTSHVKEFFHDPLAVHLSYDEKWRAIEPLADKLRTLTKDTYFQPLQVAAEKSIMEKWVAIRDEAGIKPKGINSVSRELRKTEHKRRNIFSNKPEAMLLSHTNFHLQPILPMCYDVLGESNKGKFPQQMIIEEAYALYPNAMYSYKIDEGAKFMTYFRGSSLRYQLWRKLAKRIDTTEKGVVASLDDVSGSPNGGEGSRYGDLFADTKVLDPHKEAVTSEIFAKLAQLIPTTLDAREAKIIRLRYGLGEDFMPIRDDERPTEAKTLKEMGDIMGVSRERIRQIEARAFQKLRAVAKASAEYKPDAPAAPSSQNLFSSSSHPDLLLGSAPAVNQHDLIGHTPVTTPELLVFPSYVVGDGVVLKNEIIAMYSQPDYVEKMLRDAPRDSAKYIAALALSVVGVQAPRNNSAIANDNPNALEITLLSGMFTHPESMIPYVRKNYEKDSRPRKMLEVIENPVFEIPAASGYVYGAPNVFDIEARGLARGQAMARFFKTLREKHNLYDREELSIAIADHAGLGANTAKQLHRLMNGLAVPDSQMDMVSEDVKINSKLQVRTENIKAAQAIASFAFPEDFNMQNQCIRFLMLDKSPPANGHADALDSPSSLRRGRGS